jgi:cyclic beta-1,2-glucan synthetase
LKAIQKVCEFGVHGIPLIKEGDWNDGMNLVGENGKGESIWLGWFLGSVLQSFIQRAHDRNEPETAEKLHNLYVNLNDSMHNSAWDGEWYLRAYTDDGHKLGTSTGIDCRIDSISQSWSVLSGMDSEDRQKTSMESAVNYLVDTKNELAMLLYPAFDKDPLNPGYIKDYVPGIRENGGQYSHAAFWLVMALAKQKKGELASQVLGYTNPINRSATREKLYTYELEPYVIGGDIYSSSQHMAKGGWSWYTASSGLYYRTVIESIIGFNLKGTKATFEPCVPQGWRNFSMKYTFKSSVYDISFTLGEKHNNCVTKINLDWHDLDTDTIDFVDDGREHKVLVFVS